ncbi:MAG: hypothetical protein AAF264_07940, partial [Pseudomonadota bacterium]
KSLRTVAAAILSISLATAPVHATGISVGGGGGGGLTTGGGGGGGGDAVGEIIIGVAFLAITGILIFGERQRRAKQNVPAGDRREVSSGAITDDGPYSAKVPLVSP